MKNALRQTQTLRAGCSKAEPKFFAPLQTPFPEARDGQNLIRWRWSLTLPTNPVRWRSMHAISSYCGNRPTHKQPPTHAHTIHKHTIADDTNITDITDIISQAIRKKWVFESIGSRTEYWKSWSRLHRRLTGKCHALETADSADCGTRY